MANEIHNKIIVAEAAMVFGSSFANIDSLPAGDLTWSDPLSSASWDDAEWAQVFAAISSGGTSPVGQLAFFWGRAGSNLRAGEGFGNTLTSSGTEGTDADVADILACLGSPYKVVAVNSADTVYTCEFWIPRPTNGGQLWIYNDTDEALDGTSSPHSVYIIGWGPEIQ
jgi:hypothetical protein